MANKKNAEPQLLSTVIKTAVSKVTGEGEDGTIRKYAALRLAANTKLSGNRGGQAGAEGLTQLAAIKRTANLSNTNYASPGFYHPTTTHSAFQIPNNRKEVYIWAQYWYDNEPKVAAAINFYGDFPLSGFKLECANGMVKSFFEELVKKLNFSKWLPLIAFEYYLRGDAFILASIDCEHCNGKNKTDDGTACDHRGATWRSITVLNPDMVEASAFFLDQNPNYYLMPDDQMLKVVQEQKPREIYEALDDDIKQQIAARQPILLHEESIWHLKRGSSPWSAYGQSILRPLFPILVYKDKLRQAQYIVAERHIVPIKVVKVGSEERPANDDDLQSVQEELTNVANDPMLTLVTHHNFDLDFIGASGKVLQITNEMEQIDQEIIDGLMLNKAIINGDGPSYSNAQVGLLTMAQRLEKFRGEVSHWIEERIFKPVAKWHGFTMPSELGEDEIIYPRIKWDSLQLRDQTQKLQFLTQGRRDGWLSTETLLEALEIPYDQEVERLRMEQAANFISSPEVAPSDMGVGMGAGYAGGMGMGAPPPMGAEGAPPPPMGGEGGAPAPPGGAESGIGAPDMGGMPAVGASHDPYGNYRQVYALLDESSGVIARGSTTRIAEANVRSTAHKLFLESCLSVSGCGFRGLLPEEPNQVFALEQVGPIDGGPFRCALNHAAAQRDVQLREARLAVDYPGYVDLPEHEKTPVRIAAVKKEQAQAPQLFTKLEQKLYSIVNSRNIPYPFYAQYLAGPGLAYQLDGAFPNLKLGVEADSMTFHANPEQIAKDKARDMELATLGWTILRFTEREIMTKPDDVASVVITMIRKLAGLGNQPSI